MSAIVTALPFPPVIISIDDHAEMMTVAADLDDMSTTQRETFVRNCHTMAGERGLGIQFIGRWEL